MSEEFVTSCPVCAGTIYRPYLTCIDHTATGESFHVEQCTRCEMAFTNPRPRETDASLYYESDKYISHTSAAKGILDYIYLAIRVFTLRWKYGLVKKHLKTNGLLDFGSGTGSFMNYCLSKGANAYGIEPSSKARASNTRIHNSLNQLETTQFDVITLWHVIEHVYQLHETLEQLCQHLTKTGTIFIAVPNRESYDANYYKDKWAAYDVPRHIWHFSPTNMKTLLEQKGLKLQQVVPMKLDSFYVSLLSEKYSSDNNLSLSGLFNALRVALSSNAKAKKTGNYSSLIYVATR
jgi:2-polyprenyl-3-methyl-5-hydroxy-6-metoxy-1,4-benzoquinol methylase